MTVQYKVQWQLKLDERLWTGCVFFFLTFKKNNLVAWKQS